MQQDKKHWDSKTLVIFGMWLWENGEYGHALLCMHAPQWAVKIGVILKFRWSSFIPELKHSTENKLEQKGHDRGRLNPLVIESLLQAYKTLKINDMNDLIYLNYKTGKPLTSSTLNRELQRLSEKFILDIKEKTGVELDFKPIKTNAFEIAWALDMVKKYNYSKQVFIAVSSYMGHRTVKDTIELLERHPIENIDFEFDNIKGIPSLMDTQIFNHPDQLKELLTKDYKHYMRA